MNLLYSLMHLQCKTDVPAAVYQVELVFER